MKLEETGGVSDGSVFFDPAVFASLQKRMCSLLERLRPHQRNYHISGRVDMYWYIQKMKELELLLLRLEKDGNAKLREYLKVLYPEIQRRLESDENIVQHLPGSGDA